MGSDSKVALKIGEVVSHEVITDLGHTLNNLSLGSNEFDVASTSHLQHTTAVVHGVRGGYGVREMNEKMETLEKSNIDLRVRLFDMDQRFNRIRGKVEHRSECQTQLVQELAKTRNEKASLRQELLSRHRLLVNVCDVISRWACNSLSESKEREELLKTLRARIDEQQLQDWDVCPLPSVGESNTENSHVNEEVIKRDRSIKEYEEKIFELANDNGRQEDRMHNMSEQIEKMSQLLATLEKTKKANDKKFANLETRLTNTICKISNLKRNLKKRDDTIKSYRQRFSKVARILEECDNQQPANAQGHLSKKMGKASQMFEIIKTCGHQLRKVVSDKPRDTPRLIFSQYNATANTNGSQSSQSAENTSVTSRVEDADGI